MFNGLAPCFRRDSTVQALVDVTTQSEIIRQDVTMQYMISFTASLGDDMPRLTAFAPSA